ncbi:MAG TPA: endolytic transglycosylase MltG, partial [Thermoanaerobaculia bacterium]|nr:endolytic transglycosylase MltG [Thermoanaerobaculia bacterium]
MRVPYKGYPEAKKRVEVRRGANTQAILRELQSAGVIRDQYVPLIYLKLARNRDSLKAGVYEFSGTLSAVDVVDKLVRGDVVLKTITVREGLDRFAVAKLFAAEHLGSEEEWRALTGDPDLIRDLAPEADSLEGYLFP